MKNILLLLTTALFLSGCEKDKTEVLVSNAPLPGQIFLSPYTSNATSGKLWVLDDGGTLEKQITTPGVVMNVQKWNINGTVRYTYLVEDRAGYHIPNYSSYVPGYQVIADENFNEIKKVYLQSYGDIDASSQNLLDAHDFILLSDDHYLILSYYLMPVNNIPASLNPAANVKIISPVIQEIQNNQVIWQWVGTNYPELYAESAQGNDYSNNSTPQDYLHINSMAIDPKDNNLVCSFRSADLILKINRQNGNIIWKLGGKNSSFPLTEEQHFLRQHHATFTDNDSTLLLLDNGLSGERAYSRVLEFRLNESQKTITSFKAFKIPGDFIEFMGSVQKKEDRYFIGGGSAKYLMEVNYNSGDKYFEMSLEEASYRSLKY